MTRAEFRERVNRAEGFLKGERVDRDHRYPFYYKGVCLSLNNVFLWESTADFNNRMAPPNGEGYWLGDLNEKNLEKRKNFLRVWERIVLEEKTYLEW